MKKTLVILAATCLLIDLTHAQTTAATGTGGPSSIVGYQIGEEGANSRIWQKITRTMNVQGNTTLQTNQAYIELASGLNHLVNGQWVESREEIDILPNGTAAATNGQHQAIFPGDIYQGQIELVTPDGLHLRSQPMGLSYFDGTNSVLITELTNSMGVLSGSNQVIYPNAFTGFAADVRYTYTKAGFEQDIILLEQPPTPESFGLNPATTRLEILTEFFSPPQPTIQSAVMPVQADLSLTDQSLGFGAMQMIPGRAFMLGANATDAGVRVGKQWLLLDGRQFLVEEVPVEAIADKLATLPLTAMQSGSTKISHTASRHLVLPPQRLAKTTTKPALLGKALVPTQGLVLDYQTVNGTFTSYTFQGDTTYYISGTVNLYGTNTFEGGTVIKYTNSSSAELVLNASAGSNVWTFQTGPYRPAIFTSMNDNSVGEAISGSTGSPTNTLATYLCLPGDNGYPIQYSRFAYVGTAIYQENRVNCSPVLDCQFVYCPVAIMDAVTTSNNIPVQELHNVLMSNCGVGVQNTPNFPLIVDGENMTVDQMGTLLSAGAGISGNFTNCILSSVANLTNITANVTISGDHNGFYNSPVFGTGQVPGTFYPFQAVGAGDYYLTNGCTFTKAGTAIIDPTLLADLRRKTTYPPIVYSNVTISVNTNLSFQAWRDTNAAPDLGYHYDPLDYCWNQLNLTNATLTLTNGVAIGVCGTSGLVLQGGATLVSQGTPLTPNQLVGYHSVQEQPILWGATNTGWGFLNPIATNSVITCRFTDVSSLAAAHDTIYFVGGSGLNSVTLRDCQVSAVLIYIFDPLVVSPGYVAITNNLFWRCHLDFGNIFNSYSLNFYNNLCFGGEVDFYGGSSWYVRNNLFDTVTTTAWAGVVNDHNGYYNATELSGAGGGDVIIISEDDYQTGPLGNYYYPTNYTIRDLSWLINEGSTTADQLGFYHYTVTTNQVVEGTNTVSIGFHYVAVGTNGLPLDSNGDGIPDYIEDANGNGLDDPGETPWSMAIQTQPASQTVIQGDNVTLSVTMAGIGPLVYQWWLNGTNLPGATNTSLTITNVQSTNAGTYFVVITNIGGSLTSSNAVLTITPDTRLAYWRFDNTNTWVGEEGQLPILTNGLMGVPSWSTNAVQVDNANGAKLVYRNVETNGNANISCQEGAIRFWFKPDWSGTNAGGTGLNGAGRLVELGSQTTSNGWWALEFNPGGTQLTFGTQTNGLALTNLVAPIAWTSNFWHQIVLTYSPNASTLYLDGQAVTNGIGTIYYPNAAEQTNGFRIGSDSNGTNQAQGAFDELETFNYPLSATNIATNYQTLMLQDSNGDGMGDIWEMDYFGTLNVDPNGNPAGDGLTNLQKYQAGLNPNVDYSTQSGSRLNYIYDLGGWLNQVSGIKSGAVSPDPEGNIQTVSQ